MAEPTAGIDLEQAPTRIVSPVERAGLNVLKTLQR